MSRIDFPKIYNPATQSPQELIENFVVRTELFQEIFEDIKQSDMKNPEQHYIIQGIRGQGKTTLLLRIAYEIERDAELRKRLIPIVFNEEQYNISRLFKLWETVAEYLDEMSEINGLYDEMQNFEHEPDYEWRCFQILEHSLKKHQKKIILFIDNIDEMLTKFSRREHQRLREVFLESAELRVIGASSVSLEFHYDYGKPFYQFFRMPQLRGLNTEETKTLLLKLGEYYKTERVREIVEHQAGRVEALRRMTGGVIRTIILLYEIFVDDTNGNAFLDLEKILDNVTPLYKHRMDKLSPQQQEIIDFIALSWDAVGTKEIAQKTKLESKAVSSQLKQLERYHIIEKERTDTKNYLYRIHERFFNIWYLMRLGRKWDARRVRFLVEFLQIWCDEIELEQRARKHLDAIRQSKLYDKHALLMTEALARTPLKRELQHELVAETRTYLEKEQSELKDYLCESDKELAKAAYDAYYSKNFQTALKKLEQIKTKTADDFHRMAWLYHTEFKDFQKAEQYYLQVVATEQADAMNNLALLYETEFKDFQKAEQYYLMAVTKDHIGAMNNLAGLYYEKFKDYQKAEKYYMQAVAKDHADAMFNLAQLYRIEFKDFPKAEHYYLQAVAKGDADAMNNLAALYENEFKDFPKAEHYYLMAVAKDHAGAMYNLALLYEIEFKDFQKAEQYYLIAVAKAHAGAMNNLALLYKTEFKDFKKAEQYFLQAVAKDHADAMNNLAGLYYTEFNDIKKAEQYALMAIAKDHTIAMKNLAWLYFQEKIHKQEAFEYAENSYKKNKNLDNAFTYSWILLWNNQIEQAYEIAQEFLTDQVAFEKFPEDISLFLLLFIAKKQYQLTLKLFNENLHNLKDRFKPIYYALMYFMQDEYPNEYRKMGGELKQTVEEIIEKIGQLEKDYQ